MRWTEAALTREQTMLSIELLEQQTRAPPASKPSLDLHAVH